MAIPPQTSAGECATTLGEELSPQRHQELTRAAVVKSRPFESALRVEIRNRPLALKRICPTSEMGVCRATASTSSPPEQSEERGEGRERGDAGLAACTMVQP